MFDRTQLYVTVGVIALFEIISVIVVVASRSSCSSHSTDARHLQMFALVPSESGGDVNRLARGHGRGADRWSACLKLPFLLAARCGHSYISTSMSLSVTRTP
jgi:hypothetical protein